MTEQDIINRHALKMACLLLVSFLAALIVVSTIIATFRKPKELGPKPDIKVPRTKV